MRGTRTAATARAGNAATDLLCCVLDSDDAMMVDGVCFAMERE
jgi:hypothetical protein